MKRKFLIALSAVAAMLLGSPAAIAQTPETPRAKVYYTSDISPEGLQKVYHALSVKPEGRVAVKISTGESEQSHQLDPQLIAPFVQEVKGTLVECNTAYKGSRYDTESHRREIAKRGYDKIATVDIMDADSSIRIPVRDKSHIPYDLVGANLANYDFLVNLAHFKGHQMGGFGGVLKNQSIGVASREGKALIHTSGHYETTDQAFNNPDGQDAFIESMAAAAQAVHDYFGGKAIYIDVMNNLSVDCDCNGHPETPRMKDVGILASLDPVALDKACLDLVFTHNSTADDDSAPLIQRINRQHGTHIVDYAQKIGLGTKGYELIDITATPADAPLQGAIERYNVYDMNGNMVLANADSLKTLKPGQYIVNGRPFTVK